MKEVEVDRRNSYMHFATGLLARELIFIIISAKYQKSTRGTWTDGPK